MNNERTATKRHPSSGQQHEDGPNQAKPIKQMAAGTSSSLDGDRLNIGILVFLYLLQGVPLGLISSVPLLLANKGISYSQQALFSFAIWPFSCKLIWAPIVDSLYWPRIGKRKSWLIPAQYLIGIFMIFLSYRLESMLNDEQGPQVHLLTFLFLVLNFLAATQDIAVDGWALTMLKPCNVGYASTCNTVGQTAGYFLGFVLLLVLESAQFANYFRPEPKPYGLVTLEQFFYFWGLTFVVVTTLVLIFKDEGQTAKARQQDRHMSIKQTYRKLWEILRLPPVRLFSLILLTCKIGFGVTDAAIGLKIKEAGVPMQHLAMMAIPMLPLQVALPWLIGKYTNGPRPLDVFTWAYPYRLLFCYVFAALLWWTRALNSDLGYIPMYYYIVLVTLYAAHQVTVYCMYVALMAFNAKISDPRIGGTYMTLLNTINNLGGNWPSTLSLWLIDYVTWSRCTNNGSLCQPKEEHGCPDGGQCQIWIDGYYVLTVICSLIGLRWYFWGKRQMDKIQTIPPTRWRCS